MPDQIFYVVTASVLNGGHGPWPAVVLMTRSAVRAVQTARDIEKLGYKVDPDTAVSVREMATGAVYDRKRYKRGNFTAYSRARFGRDKPWKEYFWRSDLAERFGMTEATDALHPSHPVAGADNTQTTSTL